MKLKKQLTAHLLWLLVLVNPVLAQAQQQPGTGAGVSASLAALSTETLSHISPDTASADVLAAPADTVYPGQKNPFTEAQLREGEDKRFLKRALIPAAVLVGAGLYTMQGSGFYSSHDARDDRNRFAPHFSTKVDDYLFFLPVAYLYGFNAFSSQNRHDIRRQTGLLLASGALTSAIVWPAKKLTNIDRPNGEATAFPSGHTAYAFTIATLVDKEFRHKSPWVSVGSYAIASTTGILRVMNNEHWMADVLAGAGVGILSVNTVYWLHDKLARNKGLNTVVAPTVLPNGSPGVGLSVTF
ncbi:phosphatase PAP2 family protein [Pontibacter actiniarum]|uniref:PA-phosphatase n=1 Tax=Pontibacter actiniarum TaxID=323450 RepID=A0A1X9YVI6_9BACT|nr:phosphatase PAP2 family protein [Pontibacter actiniarum]ARS36853.1 PA-phosphatase [Pontibacter actiniarum]